jgi:hypothetical protein
MDFCKARLRSREGDRQRFEIVDSSAVRRTTQTQFDVTVKYQYWDSYRRTTRPATETCAVGFGNSIASIEKGWHSLRR